MNPYLDQLICRLERINQQLKALESALTLACSNDLHQDEPSCIKSGNVCHSTHK